MNRELRKIMARVTTAQLMPQGLPEAVQVEELIRADGHAIKRVEQHPCGQYFRRMRQQVHPDAELMNLQRLLVDLASDACAVQRQCSRETPDAATDDDCLHGLLPA